MRKRFFELFLVALLAVGLSVGFHFAEAAFTTFNPPVTGSYMQPYFQEVRGVQVDLGTMPSEAGSTFAVAEIEPADVVIGAIQYASGMTTVPVDVTASIAVATTTGYARVSTSDDIVNDATVLIFFYDVDNTN